MQLQLQRSQINRLKPFCMGLRIRRDIQYQVTIFAVPMRPLKSFQNVYFHNPVNTGYLAEFEMRCQMVLAPSCDPYVE
jgi:hypothetical protein